MSFVLYVAAQHSVRALNRARCCSTVASIDSELKLPEIPNKIKRSPTELLEALSATVGEDPTGL